MTTGPGRFFVFMLDINLNEFVKKSRSSTALAVVVSTAKAVELLFNSAILLKLMCMGRKSVARPWPMLFACMVFLLEPVSVLAEKNQQVLIVVNSLSEPYLQTINSFKKQLSAQLNVSFTELGIAPNKVNAAVLGAAIHANKPDLIFALGGEATELALHESADIPIVSSLVLKNNVFRSANITGVSLMYPLTTQIQWLKKFFPDRTKVAILFNPAENGNVLQDMQKVLVQAGFELHAIPVATPKQLPDALEQLARDVEVLFAIPDEITMSPKTAKEVLLASFRNKIPFVGLSDNWVKSGAFYALSWDYDDLGKQCALQSQKILNGQALRTIPPEGPRKLTYTINTKIAEHLNKEISDDLLRNAKTTFN